MELIASQYKDGRLMESELIQDFKKDNNLTAGTWYYYSDIQLSIGGREICAKFPELKLSLYSYNTMINDKFFNYGF